ncbi:MAG: hypothetical protein OSA37_07005 [Flavobacteriales bacterium]|nr:hypothetical protein [Flavobacteriales bacterium]
MNVSQIRKMIQLSMEELDQMEAAILEQLAEDDEANDLAELGDQMTTILGAKRIILHANSEGISIQESLRHFIKGVRDIIN